MLVILIYIDFIGNCIYSEARPHCAIGLRG